MFLPYIIALLLGFVSPSNTSCASGTSTTVNTSNSEDGDPGDQPPGDDTGGETGSNPPR